MAPPPPPCAGYSMHYIDATTRRNSRTAGMHMHMRHTVNNMTDEVALERACGTLPVALFVYDVPVTDADQLDPTFPSHKWSVLRAFIELAQKSAYRTWNPACANVFLIPIATDQYARQHGLSRARQLDERIDEEMRRVGPWWDTKRSQHVVPSVGCPPMGYEGKAGFPKLHARTIRACMHADANRFERSRALHLPYYVPNGQFANTSGSANRSLLAFMSASKNTIFADVNRFRQQVETFLQTRTLSYEVLLVRRSNSSMKLASDSMPTRASLLRDPEDATRLASLLSRAKFQLIPPGDSMERAARDQSIAAGTVPVFLGPHPVFKDRRHRPPFTGLLNWNRFSLTFNLTQDELLGLRTKPHAATASFGPRLHRLLEEAGTEKRWQALHVNLDSVRPRLRWNECGVFHLSMLELTQVHRLERVVNSRCKV